MYGADVGILSPENGGAVEPLAFAQVFTNRVIQDHKLGRSVDVAVEACGAGSCTQMTITIFKAGGTVNSRPTAKELNINATIRFRPGCYAHAIDLVSRGKVDLKPLITATYPLARANEARHAACEEGYQDNCYEQGIVNGNKINNTIHHTIRLRPYFGLGSAEGP
ncbi:hypothetical protein BJY00DRAFT_317176 [Aspergillus carlsbadensis]|nr:hypothetical protein BJY00DRAFT_317176 [Aspergillus carlsbadensis]